MEFPEVAIIYNSFPGRKKTLHKKKKVLSIAILHPDGNHLLSELSNVTVPATLFIKLLVAVFSWYYKHFKSF